MFSFLLNNLFFLKWNFQYLINVFVLEVITCKYFMLAWLNYESFLKTIFYNKVFYFSRSRLNMWLKGETSLNYQFLKFFFFDCDIDCILFYVFQVNNLCCHTKNKFCFFNKFILL